MKRLLLLIISLVLIATRGLCQNYSLTDCQQLFESGDKDEALPYLITMLELEKSKPDFDEDKKEISIDCQGEGTRIIDVKAKDGKLSWIAPAEEGKVTDVVRYVVYRFADKKSVNLEDASAIVVVTPKGYM